LLWHIMDILVENKKSTISFVLGLVVMGLVWILFSIFSSMYSVKWKTLSSDVQQKISLAKANFLARSETAIVHSWSTFAHSWSAFVRSWSTITRSISKDWTMPWSLAIGVIQNWSVEKIEVNALTLRVIIKWGISFTTTQPTKDAYVKLLETAKSKIEIVK